MEQPYKLYILDFFPLCGWCGGSLVYLAFVWPRSARLQPPVMTPDPARKECLTLLGFFAVFAAFATSRTILCACWVVCEASLRVCACVRYALCACLREYLCGDAYFVFSISGRHLSPLSACSEIFPVCGCIAHGHVPTKDSARCRLYVCDVAGNMA